MWLKWKVVKTKVVKMEWWQVVKITNGQNKKWPKLNGQN